MKKHQTPIGKGQIPGKHLTEEANTFKNARIKGSYLSPKQDDIELSFS
jgi:hypothetical protein